MFSTRPHFLNLLAAAVFVALLFSPASALDRDAFRVAVHAKDTVALLPTLERNGRDVAGRNGPGGFVEVIVSSTELDALRKAGYDLRVIERYKDKTTAGVPAGYHDYDDIKTILFDTQANHPGIAKVIDVGQTFGNGNTFEGRSLYALKISDNADVYEDETNVFIVSNHHAREITTPEFALWIIEKLTTLYGIDPDITRWVDQNQIYVAPTWNPDGLEHCFNVYAWWRKNRTPVGGGNFGVDQNRNYDFNWDGPYGGSTNPSSDTYRGPYVASEQETQATAGFALNRRFAKVLDFHSHGSEVLYTYYQSSSFPAPIENYFEAKAIEFAYALNYGGSYRKPSAEGEHYQWELCDVGAFSFLVETGNEFQPSFSTAQAEFDNHIWPGVQWFLDHETPLRGHVVEAISGDPIPADIAIKGINYTQGEIRKAEGQFGRFHYFLPPGTYEVTFSSLGYGARTFDVVIDKRQSTLLEVQLGPGPTLTVNGKASQNGLLNLDFDWPAGAGHQYLNGISFIDTGFFFKNGVHVPIGWDYLYQFSLGAFPGWMGTLDGFGHAAASLPIPQDPLMVGLEFFMAYFTLYPSTTRASAASAAVKISIDV